MRHIFKMKFVGKKCGARVPGGLLRLLPRATFYNVCPSHVCVFGRISPLRGLIGQIDRLFSSNYSTSKHRTIELQDAFRVPPWCQPGEDFDARGYLWVWLLFQVD